MEFSLSPEHELIRKTAREFAERELAATAVEEDRSERFHRQHWRRLAELGFLGFLIPERYGGVELGNLALCLALEEINRASASVGVSVSVQNSLVSSPIARFGSEEQKARWLPALARGERIGAYALTEPGHGSDAASLETRAQRRKDGAYVLNGGKAWITNAPMAGLALVFANVAPGSRAKGITAFLVDPATPGFQLGRKERKMGIRGSESCEIALEDVVVPANERLGEEGQGFKIAMDTLNGGRIGIAAQAIGIARACLEASGRHARERRQFGKPIGEFQPVQWKLADMATGIEAARLLAQRAAWLRDQGLPHTAEAAMAKLSASELANRAAADAVQIHGGAGYCMDLPVERYFRDARITEIYEGTSEIQRLVIARELLAAAGA